MKTAAILSVRGILESNTLLNALTEDQMVQLAQVSKIAHADKGEPIWINHKDVGFFGLMGAGFVKMVKSCTGGTEVTLEIMGPGQPFGMLGVIDGLGCPLMAYAMTDAVYLRIPKPALIEVYQVNHVLKDRLVRKTALRMHQKLDFISKLTSGNVHERVAAVLFVLADSYGVKAGSGIRLDVPLTRQQIGEMAGTTTETTIRIFSRWTQEEILETSQQVITILDPVALEQKMSNLIRQRPTSMESETSANR